MYVYSYAFTHNGQSTELYVAFKLIYHFLTYAVQAAVLCGSTTGIRKYSAKTEKEPQSERKPSVTFHKTTAAFRRLNSL